MKQDKNCIKRKIYFYRIDAGCNAAGEPLDYDVEKALAAIEKLSFHTDDRYLKDDDGYDISCWIDDFNPPQKAQFGKIRRDDLPRLEHKGELTDLTIPGGGGLAECVHVMFFQKNIVGVEFNFDGPRVSRISDYLQVKAQNISPQPPVFEQLLARDIMKKLEKMQTVRQFRLKARDSLFSATKQASVDLNNTFQAAKQLGPAAKEIELTLSIGKGKGSLGRKILDIAKTLITLRDTTYDIISGQIKGYDETGKTEIIDLLNAKLVAEKSIPRRTVHNRAIQDELVYIAIEEAYEELKDELHVALGATLCEV